MINGYHYHSIKQFEEEEKAADVYLYAVKELENNVPCDKLTTPHINEPINITESIRVVINELPDYRLIRNSYTLDDMIPSLEHIKPARKALKIHKISHNVN